MRVFLLAPTYMGLHKHIVDELKHQGHEVFMIEDVQQLPLDYLFRPQTLRGHITRPLKAIANKIIHLRRRYWQNIIRSTPQLHEPYDIFVCINGSSYEPILTCQLQRFNPSIKTTLYLWDSNRVRNFFWAIPYFDKVLSFDMKDCQDCKKLKFLPFYWLNIPDEEPKYDLSLIGSAHSGRLEFADKIYRYLDKNKSIRKFFRIINTNPDRNLKESAEYVISDPIAPAEMMKVINQSNCVLDTSMDGQTGTTPRFIWALGLGKKIITTNKFSAQLPFYDPKYIQIIDFNNPTIDIEFITKQVEPFKSDFLDRLRIDNWVKVLLQEKDFDAPDF